VINTSLQRFSTTSNEAVMSITKFLAKVKDYRKPQGKRYNLSSVLRLVLAGLLCGTNNLATIHRWAKTLSKKALIDLGFYKGKLLSYSNLTIILRQIDCDDRPILHIDGKFLKKSNCFGDKIQAQILTMFDNRNNATVGYESIVGRDEYHAMLKLLTKGNIKGAIITADAAFTHEEILEEIVNQEADFAISLKGNEVNLMYHTEKLFNEADEKKLEIKFFQEPVDCVHGRIEQRSIEVMDMPWEYLNGHKNIKQLCKITRFREYKNDPKSVSLEVAYMVTSLDKSYNPEDLLKLNRSHWSCENNLNWVKDAIFLEDKSTISVGNTPFVMSLLRSLSIQIIKTVSDKITETREMFNQYKFLLWRKFANSG
jgi:predicted transposase YbfD/YdcC